MPEPKVLIVGAGPTGLVLSISLARHGVPIRLIDEASGPGQHSRAMAVHARILEFYRQFGFVDEVISDGIPFNTVHLRERGANGKSREVVQWSVQSAGQGLSRYPYILSYPQDEHERLLIRQLEKLHLEVEWNTALKGFHQEDDKVVADIEGPHRTEQATFSYICGCDGAHSQVRETLGVGFSGGTYQQSFYVADVKVADQSNPDFYLNLGPRLIALMVPVRTTGMTRLIGLVPPNLKDKPNLSFEDIRAHIEELISSTVTEVNWFSNYHSHHRLAGRFRVGRAFLLGDAAHVHSPVGGQGMNTGIGDAVNLGWKLAQAISGNPPGRLLDSYEQERMKFARALVATTDSAFTTIISEGWGGWLLRRFLMPLIATILSWSHLARRLAFKTISQLRIEYRDSPISEGAVGYVVAGDRLPWVNYGTSDNFTPLDGIHWQLHMYGDAEVGLRNMTWIPLHRFEWSKEARAAGLRAGALYLIRPDGYIGLALQSPDLRAVCEYALKLGIPQ